MRKHAGSSYNKTWPRDGEKIVDFTVKGGFWLKKLEILSKNWGFKDIFRSGPSEAQRSLYYRVVQGKSL